MINYKDFVCTLQEISVDTSKGCYMSVSSKEAVNFDEFSEAYFKSFHEDAKKPDSVDAVCMLNNKWCLIEFKNGYFNRKDICNKIGNSISIILIKDNVDPEYFKNNSIFILVYNKESKGYKEEQYKNFREIEYISPSQCDNSTGMDTIREMIGIKAKTPIVLFKMNTFKEAYFSDVMTMDKDIFDKYINTQIISIPNT